MDRVAPNGHNAGVKRSSLWMLPLLLAVLVSGAWYFTAQAKKGDRELGVYVTGGDRMAAGEEIYLRGTDLKPFTYPPFAAVPFVPFGLIPDDWQASAWFVINFLILLGIVRWLHRYASAEETGRSPPRLVWFWGLTAALGGRHVVSVFTNQSNDLLIAGLLALAAAAWCRNRAVAGMWVGLGAAMKATPLLLLGLFGLRRRWGALLWLVVAMVLATVMPDYLFPRNDGGSWWRAWYDVNLSGLEVGGTAEAVGAWGSHSVLNQSLSGTLVRLFTPVKVDDVSFVVGYAGQTLLFELPATVVKILTLAMQVGILAVITFGVMAASRAVRTAMDGARSAVQRTLGLGEMGAFACGMLLLSPQSSKAHFCIWLFSAAFVANYLVRTRRDAIAIVLGVGAMVLGLLSKGMFGRQMGNIVLAYGCVAWSTLLLLFATVRCLQVAARPSQP